MYKMTQKLKKSASVFTFTQNDLPRNNKRSISTSNIQDLCLTPEIPGDIHQINEEEVQIQRESIESDSSSIKEICKLVDVTPCTRSSSRIIISTSNYNEFTRSKLDEFIVENQYISKNNVSFYIIVCVIV